MPDVLKRIENVLDSAKFVRTELKQRLKKYRDAGIHLDADHGLGKFLANSIYGIDIVCKQTSALLTLCKRLLKLATVYDSTDIIPIASGVQRQIISRYAKPFYRYDREGYRYCILIPVRNVNKVLVQCIKGQLKQNAVFARNIRKAFEALQR